MIHTISQLDYSYDSLEPFIDQKTMEIHHSKHHQAYVDNLNKALPGTAFEDLQLENIFADIDKVPAAIRNNAGGHYNHSLFWKLLSPDGEKKPIGSLADAIDNTFISFDLFKQKFADAATGRFGSGWVWLILDRDNKLQITATPYQDNPLMSDNSQTGLPILALDVWEHAYYLAYQNKRADYIGAFWNVVNWNYAEELYLKAQALI